MSEETRLLLSLAGVVAAGVGANWLATRFRTPSILFLLAAGVLVGPVLGWLHPDETFGKLLLPAVSLAVGVILFEGGLSLRIDELTRIGRPLVGLLTVGAFATWLICALAAWRLFPLPFSAALLLGAILVVTGPTVVTPLLQHIRPSGVAGQVARWEGIVIDPIGAIAAVLVFEAAAPAESASWIASVMHSIRELAITIGLGAVAGLLTAFVLTQVLRRHWAPDHLQSPIVFGSVLAAFALSNALQAESGLVTVTVMGVVLANQKRLDLKHIVQFKETLTVLLISTLFVVLTARLDLEQFVSLGWRGLAFLVVVVFVARPIAVALGTFGSQLTLGERVFLSWLAPRGIVAAAVSSVFALEMGEGGEVLVTATFLVIVGTVAIYGLSSAWVARRVGLSVPDPQGVLFAGANATARAVALALQKCGVSVRLVDTNRDNIRRANMDGLPTLYANVLSDTALETLDLAGIGRFVAVTPNDEVNSLACVHFHELFGRVNVYRLNAAEMSKRRQASEEAQYGRVWLEGRATLVDLERLLDEGWRVTVTRITSQFTAEDFERQHQCQAIVAMALDEGKLLTPAHSGKIELREGLQVIAFVPE